MVKNNKTFEYDLLFGELREQRISEILQNKKIEVKTERGLWQETGNIAIEIAYRGKPSGLATTEADYWLHILERDGQEYCSLLLPVEVLKNRLRELYTYPANGVRVVMGGDNQQSKLVLVPIAALFGVN